MPVACASSIEEELGQVNMVADLLVCNATSLPDTDYVPQWPLKWRLLVP
jgi:hypothetical protein